MEILFVCDDHFFRLKMRMLLTEWTFKAVFATDGAAALEEMRRTSVPRLVLLDWKVKDMDSLSLCRRIREQEQADDPFIILFTFTGGGSVNATINGLETGADAFIPKPFLEEELLAHLLAGYCRLKRQHAFRERERLRGGFKMAGALCNDIALPLQNVMSHARDLLANSTTVNPNHNLLLNIKAEVEYLDMLMKTVLHIAQYRTGEHRYEGGAYSLLRNGFHR